MQEMEVLTIVSFFALGAFSGFLGATVGGGGLLMIPYLMLTGLAPQVAVASARFGDIGLAALSSIKFWREKRILWKYVPLLAALSLAGSLIGANILLAIDPDHLKQIAATLLLLLLPIVLFKKEIGTVRRRVSGISKVVSAIMYFIIQIVTGFFGAGTGPLTQYTLMAGLGFTIIEGAATQMLPFLLLTVSSTIVFALHDLIDYSAGIPLIIGSGIGGYLGAHVAGRTNVHWLKAAFAVMVVLAAGKLLFF